MIINEDLNCGDHIVLMRGIGTREWKTAHERPNLIGIGSYEQCLARLPSLYRNCPFMEFMIVKVALLAAPIKQWTVTTELGEKIKSM
jgi:hypothetical protein